MSTETPEEKLAVNRAWKERNKDRVSAYNKERHRKRMEDPEKYAAYREFMKARYSKYAANSKQKDRSRDKVKLRARGIVRNHIWRGKLSRLPCEQCGEVKSHAHHEEYSRPLDVKWLCVKCHVKLHKDLK